MMKVTKELTDRGSLYWRFTGRGLSGSAADTFIVDIGQIVFCVVPNGFEMVPWERSAGMQELYDVAWAVDENGEDIHDPAEIEKLSQEYDQHIRDSIRCQILDDWKRYV